MTDKLMFLIKKIQLLEERIIKIENRFRKKSIIKKDDKKEKKCDFNVYF